MTRFRTYFISFCTVLLAFPLMLGAQSVTIDLDSVRQTIRGFGGIHITSWQGTTLNGDLQEKAFDNDPGEIGLSILRLMIDPDSNRFDSELDIAQYAVSRGALVFASPWNPPAELLDPDASIRKIPHENYGEYVKHLNRFDQFMADHEVPLYAISVQNEPDYGEWTRWTAAEIATFLKENGQDIQTRVIAPESFQFRHNYTDSILNDGAALANLDIVGGHIYGGGLEDYPLARELGKEVWMTEHLTGSGSPEENTWNLALALGTEINSCMKANFNAYVWWYIRRFYGLITDDGNISKKGYVMSQFTKFIRPGAVRVDAIPESTSGIASTAYKTDTSLVIVVVNTNSTATSLDFTLNNNPSIDSLTKFTTSETKDLINEGGVSITGNSFSAVLDARSITTFTSHNAGGGKYGNIPPIASAGQDTIIIDSTGIGMFDILLDASSSTDPDGQIVNVSWSIDERQVSWEMTHTASFGVGEHLAVLTVTDEDGARNIDTLVITVISTFSTEIWLEAECGIVGSTWEINKNAQASHGYYVNTPAGTESTAAASSDTADHLIFNFHIEEAGPYKVWGRVIAPTANDDSFWVLMDEDTVWVGWNGIVGGSDWHWDDVHDWNNENPVTWQLDTGWHKLSVCYREDGTLLDKLYISNTGSTPEGPGVEDTTCPADTTEDALPAYRHSLADLLIYPNPTRDRVQVSWEEGFSGLSIASTDGRILQREEYPTEIHSVSLDLDLQPGLYHIILHNKYNRIVRNFRME
ncbi:MAG: hypothetical protein JW801_10975 [Bacteroidales bacterium]|nr:hypothetical protein [Bacteroidales bacterium]